MPRLRFQRGIRSCWEDGHEAWLLSGSEDGDKHASHVIGRLWVVECVPWEGGWVRMIEVNESCGKHAYTAVIDVVLNHRWDVPDRRCGESIGELQ